MKQDKQSLFRIAVILAAFLPVSAQLTQQGGKLLGTGAVGNAGQGSSLALSADGNTAIEGGPGDNSGAGAVWVFTRAAGAWSQQGVKLVGTGAVLGTFLGAAQGTSVALSADGNTALVGGNGDNSGTGAVWVFTRSAGVWAQQGNKLVGTGASGNARQGYSVSLSSDGNTAIVGGPYDSGQTGAAWIFTRSGGVWTQQGGKLVGTASTGTPQQGFSVAMSGDGKTAIVGGPGKLGFDTAVGATWVFTNQSGTWTQQGSKLVGSNATQSWQGASVAISGDGDTALVGGYHESNFVGAVWIFVRSGTTWAQQGSKLNGSGAANNSIGAQQGYAVSLSADGNTAIWGAPDDNSLIGAVWEFTRSGGQWTQVGTKLTATGEAALGTLGSSVALSADGTTVAAGTFPDTHETGGVWMFGSAAAPGPSISSGGVMNGASFLSGIAPGSWITIQGTNLSATNRTWTNSDFVGNNLPTQLDGVRVTVDGLPAYVYFVSPTQLNVLSPADPSLGPVPIQVSNGSGTSNIVSANLGPLSPGLFTFNPMGGRYAAAVHLDGAYLGPSDLFPGSSTPAKPGDTILLFGTGFGATSPPVTIGLTANSGPLSGQPTVRIGGVVATTLFGGIISPGLYQFNVIVPNLSDGDQAVLVEVGGVSSQSNLFLSVHH
jgi:uncharacterized protein (TIGR03437 family)